MSEVYFFEKHRYDISNILFSTMEINIYIYISSGTLPIFPLEIWYILYIFFFGTLPI